MNNREHSRMDVIPKSDPRYERTEADLMDAFRILAGKKDPADISVSEITRLTGITRTTFYNHYVDMPDFIESMENRMIEEVFMMIREFPARSNAQLSREFFRSLCVYIDRNRFLAKMLVTPWAVSFVDKALHMLRRYTRIRLEQQSETDERKAVYGLAYSIGGIVGVLHRWAADGCSDSPDQVSAYLTDLFLYNLSDTVQ